MLKLTDGQDAEEFIYSSSTATVPCGDIRIGTLSRYVSYCFLYSTRAKISLLSCARYGTVLLVVQYVPLVTLDYEPLLIVQLVTVP